MKIVVIGGSGLIGSRVVRGLREQGHEVIAASPDSGVNSLTGEGLDGAFAGAVVVVDVSNSPSFEDAAVLEFFETSTRNLLDVEARAGVGHHVALSIVGTEDLPNSGYMRAKVAQEKLIKGSSIPYSIVHATQFFEFVARIADEATTNGTVRLPHVLFQPMAADDVAAVVTRVAVGAPLNGTIEVAGPEQFRFDDLIRLGLRARNDPREVVADPHAKYFGTELDEHSLVPGDGAVLGTVRFEDWLEQSANGAAMTASAPPMTMRALRGDGSTVADLRYQSTPCPPWEPGWLLLRVHAVGVDSDELLWPSTWSTHDGMARTPSTLGRDVSGVVVQADRDSGFAEGDDVFGVVDWWRDGATAEYVLVRPDHVVAKPPGISHADAATMPTAAMVALRTVDLLGDMSTGRRLLVDGRPDAVALLTIQLARRNGIDVIGTGAGSDAEYLAFFGVNDVVEASRERVLDVARAADLILSTRETGHVSWLSEASERPVATPSLPSLAERAAGETSVCVTLEPSQALLRRLASIAEEEHLRSPVAFALPLALARDAYEWDVKNSERLRGRAVLEPIEDIRAYEIDPILELVEETERGEGFA